MPPTHTGKAWMEKNRFVQQGEAWSKAALSACLDLLRASQLRSRAPTARAGNECSRRETWRRCLFSPLRLLNRPPPNPTPSPSQWLLVCVESLVKSPPTRRSPVKPAGAPGGLAFVFTGIIKTCCLSGKINKSCSKVQENYAPHQYCSTGTTGGWTGKMFKNTCWVRLHLPACLLFCGH